MHISLTMMRWSMDEKILFVDDDANILEAYKRQLRKQFTVETVLGGEEGLTAIRMLGPFAVVVSDFRGPDDWRVPLLDLAGRHTVVAVEIRDRREQELPDVGELWLVDPESGRQLRVDTGSRRLRA